MANARSSHHHLGVSPGDYPREVRRVVPVTTHIAASDGDGVHRQAAPIYVLVPTVDSTGNIKEVIVRLSSELLDHASVPDERQISKSSDALDPAVRSTEFIIFDHEVVIVLPHDIKHELTAPEEMIAAQEHV